MACHGWGGAGGGHGSLPEGWKGANSWHTISHECRGWAWPARAAAGLGLGWHELACGPRQPSRLRPDGADGAWYSVCCPTPRSHCPPTPCPLRREEVVHVVQSSTPEEMESNVENLTNWTRSWRAPSC